MIGVNRVPFQKIQCQERRSMKNDSHACAMSVVKTMSVAYIAIPSNTKRIGRLLSTKDNVNGYNVPPLRPATTSRAMTASSEWQKGIRKLAAVKIHAHAKSTRLGPRRPPRYTEKGPINIMEALNVVLIQAPSSTPRCNAPRMSARPTLIKRPVHVAMSAPRSTPATPSNGRVVTVGRVSCVLASGPVIDGHPLVLQLRRYER